MLCILLAEFAAQNLRSHPLPLSGRVQVVQLTQLLYLYPCGPQD